jgi:hypothetical protein
MADVYVDFDLGTGDNDGTTWANAYHTTTPVQFALTDAGAGGRVFIKSDADATSTGEETGAQTFVAGGTLGNPVSIVGVKPGTTNAPPVNTDILDRESQGVNKLVVWGSSNGRVVLQGTGVIYGCRLETGSSSGFFEASTDTSWDFHGCEVVVTSSYLQAFRSRFRLFNCEAVFDFDANCFVRANNGYFEMVGGLISGVAANDISDDSGGVTSGTLRLRGVDLSNGVGNVFDAPTTQVRAEISNCKTPTSWTLVSGQGTKADYCLTAIGCSTSTGKTSGQSFRDFIEETYEGTVETETTRIRMGGANDGADGGFSYAMTPNATTTAESLRALISPWMTGWVAGDGSTAFTFTCYIANDLAASAANDFHEDEIWLEVLVPSEAGDATHEQSLGDWPSNVISGSTTSVTDDTGSSWGSGANNHQKMSATFTPDFSGPFYARVHFAQRGTNTCYVDPKIEVA